MIDGLPAANASINTNSTAETAAAAAPPPPAPGKICRRTSFVKIQGFNNLPAQAKALQEDSNDDLGLNISSHRYIISEEGNEDGNSQNNSNSNNNNNTNTMPSASASPGGLGSPDHRRNGPKGRSQGKAAKLLGLPQDGENGIGSSIDSTERSRSGSAGNAAIGASAASGSGGDGAARGSRGSGSRVSFMHNSTLSSSNGDNTSAALSSSISASGSTNIGSSTSSTGRATTVAPGGFKAAKVLGMESSDILKALPRTSEQSIGSQGSGSGALRFGRYASRDSSDSFNDDESSVLTNEVDDFSNALGGIGKNGSSAGGGKRFGISKKKTRRAARNLITSIRRKTPDDNYNDNSNIGPHQRGGSDMSASAPTTMVHFSSQDTVETIESSIGSTGNLRGRMARGLSGKWSAGGTHYPRQNARFGSGGPNDLMFNNNINNNSHDGLLEENTMRNSTESRKSVSARRDNIDAKSLTMGLDLESANFLDWMTQAKCEEWLKSLCRRDPRACIKMFFDDVARDGADSIEEENGFQPELLSPLLSMFQRSSVFSVWRPTSVDSIRKMMTGQGTGKGLDIKGKSAKKGKLSAYVPFLQIHEDEHKTKIRTLPSDGRIRIFYKKREARDKAHKILSEVMADMMEASNMALNRLLESDKVPREELTQDDALQVGRVLSSFRSLSMKGDLSSTEEEEIRIVNEWEMDNPSIVTIDDYSPKCFGLDLPKRLFWEGYVMRAKDISREPGSVYDTGRPSRASFQDMNFASIKNENECEEDMPRAVVWQYTDPYLPPTEPDPDPMMPQTLLMAYEEHGRVMPVVSDFDCFLLGTRGVRFHNPLPDEQVELVHNMLSDIEKILKDCSEGKSKNWTASWLHVMKYHKKHITMPKYGFGDPKSYAIMKYAVQRLEEFGAVRHGAECFNFYFPQELDDEFLVIGGNLGGAKYKYMKLSELQDFLSGCIDLGFTFPLNPKWVLCDEGWKALWDKLTGSTHPNVQLSINAWYPPGSGLKERILEIQQKYPEGFQSDLSGRKKGTQAWDEAEIALDRYQRIQRAKRKLWIILCWISIVQQSRKKVQAAKRDTLDDSERSSVGEMEGPGSGNVKEGDPEQVPAEKRVSFQDHSLRNSMTSQKSNLSDDLSNIKPLTDGAIMKMGEKNHCGLVRARTVEDGPPKFTERFRRSSSLSCEGSEENLEVIDSILMSTTLALTEFQMAGLRRIRNVLLEKSETQPRINNRMERRHTSIDGRLTAMMLEDVPSFILKEYGGVKQGDVTMSFKAQVKKIMTAQRLIGASKTSQRLQSEHFLPVEWTKMSTKLKEELAEKLSFKALSRWDYNMIEVSKLCDGSPLLFIGWAIMGSPHAQQAMAHDLGQEILDSEPCGYNFISEFSVQMPILCSFLRTVESDYLPNPYHNNTHAADVLQTLNTMLQLGGKDYASSPLDLFSILVAAVIHDVKHPGLNNNYHVNSRSELAVQYNDVSVLENFSITWLFSKLLGQTRDFTVDIFSGLTNDQFSKARSIIIRSVLETDMTHHFALLKKMGIHQENLKGKMAEDWLETYTNEGVNYDPSMDMLCFLLHQADISNPAKPYPLFIEWADNILAECYAQGDKESSLNLPVSPLCDRVSTDKKQSQIGFIKFVVQPSYQLLGEIIPRFAETVFPHIAKSLEFWDNYENDDLLR